MVIRGLVRIDSEDRWLKRLAWSVRDYLAWQDRDKLFRFTALHLGVADATTSVEFGHLRAVKGTSVAVALHPVRTTASARYEIREVPLSRDLGVWFLAKSRRTAERLARGGAQTFQRTMRLGEAEAAQSLRETYTRPILSLNDQKTGLYGIKVNLTVPSPDQAPVPLLIADIALFFLQTARAAVGLKPYSLGISRYARVGSPGEVVGIPGPQRILSEYRCPQCREVLRSSDMNCSRCEWELHPPRHGHGDDDSTFGFENQDT